MQPLLFAVPLIALLVATSAAGQCREDCHSQRRVNQNRCVNSEQKCNNILKNLNSKCNDSMCWVWVGTRGCIKNCKASLRREAKKCKSGCRNAAINQLRKCNAGCDKIKKREKLKNKRKELKRKRKRDQLCACPRIVTRIYAAVNCTFTPDDPGSYKKFPNQCVAECDGYGPQQCESIPSQFGPGLRT